MPRPSRRDQIIDVAERLFAARGFESVSTRDVAGVVGMKSSALYHHFKDKMDLTLAVMERVSAERAGGYARILTLDVAPEQKLKAIVHHQIRNFSENPNAIRLFQFSLLDGGEQYVEAVLHDIYRDISEDICRCIRAIDKSVDVYFVHFSIIVMSLGYISFRPLIEQFHPLKKRDREPKFLVDVVLRAALPKVDWKAVELVTLSPDKSPVRAPSKTSAKAQAEPKARTKPKAKAKAKAKAAPLTSKPRVRRRPTSDA